MTTILKWAGNKTAIMPELIKHLPAGSRLVEPFAGSCAVMMATDYPHYLVADINHDLINLYLMIQTDHEAVIQIARELFKDFNSDVQYYRVRQHFNYSISNEVEKAAYFLYLNRHAIVVFAVITRRVNITIHTDIIKSRTSLKMKYAHLPRRLNVQRLFVPAMTKHWRCCRLVMLFIVIRHTMAHLAVITLPVLQRTISVIWRLFLSAGHPKVIRLSCPTATRP